ncbi:Jerky protein homolog-like [Eumeta japonica]|uniref:Jerky protein homolog-like n=1 Tax=Eumeta variegata TaxID=151549 RepID=A0A4C1SSZ4_EUMVA|nr:Jerky protein homolog-like [Eumeta japonica]
MIKQKAIELHNQMKENNHAFNASDGWLQKFKKRYGIRLLKICGEKLSARHHLVEPYKQKLKRRIEELGLNNDQLYNADESGLCWKNVPNKTYVSSLEKTAPGAKME